MNEIDKLTMVDELVHHLEKIGVKAAFGVSGGFIVPLWEALSESTIKTIHCRHESGAAFCASEYSLYNDVPTVSFSTAGPGIINSLTGLKAAKLDGAKVIFISAITVEEHNGRYGLQETSKQDINKLVGYGEEGFFDKVIFVDTKENLKDAINAIYQVKISLGTVLGIFISTAKKKLCLDSGVEVTVLDDFPGGDFQEDASLAAYQSKVAESLSSGNAILWNGFGCRNSSEIFSKIAIETNTPVISTPRGKGIFPEKKSLYIGTTGLGSDGKKLDAILRNPDLKTIVILGTRLGEFSSSYLQDLMHDVEVYYIGVEANFVKRNLPHHAIVINTEISIFLKGIYLKIKKHTPTNSSPIKHTMIVREADEDILNKTGVIHPQNIMEAIQKIAIDDYDCLIAADAGNSFVWTNRYLKFQTPNRYRVSTALGTMAHYACGIVGLAATGKTTLGIIGDGSMLMNNEVSTAVRYKLPAIWLVMNDHVYNMCRQGLNLLGAKPLDCTIPEVDFSLLASALGADGVTATNISDLEIALRRAIEKGFPTIIDVHIDKSAQPPLLDRISTIKSL